ncbi:MAG: nucleotide sugar dehydrogenase, partial [Myxococcota bacterium]
VVVGVESDPAVRGAVWGPHPTEPGLDALLAQVSFEVVERPVASPVYAVCVGTPVGPDRAPDLRELEAALDQVAEVALAGALVVIESTVPVGTTDAAAERLRRRVPGARVAACPERVLPGRALHELVNNPRIAGGVDPASGEAAAQWLRSFVDGPVEVVDARTAELAKLVENAARDVEIALANTVAATAAAHGVDPARLRSLVNRHPRVALLEPGIGVGGHCLPVDPWFLIARSPATTRLFAAAREVNDAAAGRWAAEIARVAAGRPIGLLGLAYKADSDDPRNAPAVEVARALARDHDVIAADPFVREAAGVSVAPLDQVLARPVVALLVAHSAYRGLRPPGVAVDACGGWA